MTGPDGRAPEPAPQPDRRGAAPGVALRPVAPADAALLAALQEAAFASAEGAPLWARAWSADAMAALLALPATFGHLAAAGEAPVGFVLAQAAGGEAEILTLAVVAERRRAGCGAALMAAAAAEARARGAGRLVLEVAASNAAARRFYAGLGFRRIGMRRNYYGEGLRSDDAVVLARNLYG